MMSLQTCEAGNNTELQSSTSKHPFEDDGVALAVLVGAAAFGRELLDRGAREAEVFGEELGGLGGECDHFLKAALFGLFKGVAREFLSDALALMIGLDADAGEFDQRFIVGDQAGASDDAVIHFVQVEVFEPVLHLLHRSGDQLVGLGRVFDQRIDVGNVVGLGPADAIVFIRVDHGAETNLVEDLDQQTAIDAAIENVHTVGVPGEHLDRVTCLAEQ